MEIKRVMDKHHQYSFYMVFSQKAGTTATMAVAAVPPLPGLLFFFFFFFFFFSLLIAAVIKQCGISK
jgi:hypothetical protein